jgi:hypothetical protein
VIPGPVCSVCGGCKPADLQLGSSRSSSYSQLSSPAIDTAVRPCKIYSCQILEYNCQTVHTQLSGPARDTAVRSCNTTVRPYIHSCQALQLSDPAIQLPDRTYTAVRPCRHSCQALQQTQLSRPATDTTVTPCNRHGNEACNRHYCQVQQQTRLTVPATDTSVRSSNIQRSDSAIDLQ